MIRSAYDNHECPAEPARGLWIAMVVLAAAFFLVEHDLRRSQFESFSVTAEDMEDSVQTGDTWRQVAFFSVAALGGSFLFAPGAKPLSLRGPMAWLILAGVASCVASVAWSIDTLLTAKRVAVLLFCLLGALGVAARLSPRQLVELAMFVLAAYITLGIGAELALGTFRPWTAEYRFAGTVHPNTQGAYCGILCLAAAAMAGSSPRARMLPLALFAAAVVLLLLTRSRSAFAATAAALVAIVFLRSAPRARLLTVIGGAWVAAAVLWACAMWGTDPEDALGNAVLLGRTDKSASLSGRLPLWNELLPYMEKRPLLGYGYNSFWTQEHIADVSEASEWAIHTAHSVYVDTILSLGLVGAAILLLVVVIGAWRLVAQYLATRDAGYAFLLGVLVFGAAGGVLESSFLQPMFIPLIAACGLLHAAFLIPENDQT